MKTKPIKQPKMVESHLRTRITEHFASGGESDSGSDENLAKGGEVGKHADNHRYNYDDEEAMKGVNKVMPTYSKERGLRHDSSEAGSMAKKAGVNGDFSEGARARHKKTLKEMQDMPDPKLKGLAEGGEVDEIGMEIGEGPEADKEPSMSPIRRSYMAPDEDEFMADHFAEGGEAMADDEMEDDKDSSIAAAIMSKEDRKKMAHGGEILEHDNADDISSSDSIDSSSSGEADLSRNADEDANEEDQLSYNALRKENYSESDGLESLSQPDDSNESGDTREESRSDKRDRVGAIMSKMSRKRK